MSASGAAGNSAGRLARRATASANLTAPVPLGRSVDELLAVAPGPVVDGRQIEGRSPRARDRRLALVAGSRVTACAGIGDDGLAVRREHEGSGHRIRIGDDDVAGPELALEERPCERVLDESLDRPLERSGTERGVRSLADDQQL